MWKIMLLTFVGLVTTAPTDTDGIDFTPINEFSLKLLSNTYAAQRYFGSKNIAISPLSVWNIFSLLAEGSSGETFHELMRGLKLPRHLRATQALHFTANNILKTNNKDVILNGQSAMFSECSLPIHQEFCQAAVGYNTDVYSVDTSNVTKLADDINYYVCVATQGKIVNAVKPEILMDLKMIIVDALYFKANWTVPFNPEQTKEQPFYDPQGKVLGAVNMMYHKGLHNFGDLPQLSAQILDLSYGEDRQFAMLILLPYEGMPVLKLLENLVAQPHDWLREFTHSESLQQVDCFVPRFTISSQTDLIPPMQYSGIISIFDKQKAQLPGVSDVPLFVSKSIQNVEIEVNESGTVAASSTVVGLENRVLGPRFEVNKEFVFLIVEKKTNVILFAGVYEVPALV